MGNNKKTYFAVKTEVEGSLLLKHPQIINAFLECSVLYSQQEDISIHSFQTCRLSKP